MQGSPAQASACHSALGTGVDSSQPVRVGQKCCALQLSAKYLLRGDDGVLMPSFIPHLPGLILSLCGLSNYAEKYKLSTVWWNQAKVEMGNELMRTGQTLHFLPSVLAFVLGMRLMESQINPASAQCRGPCNKTRGDQGGWNHLWRQEVINHTKKVKHHRWWWALIAIYSGLGTFCSEGFQYGFLVFYSFHNSRD